MVVAPFVVGCVPGKEVNKKDDTKTQLDVTSFEGGFGQEWLYAARDRFEEVYKDVSFEPGKVGVQVTVQPDEYSLPPSNITGSKYHVFFYESLNYNSYIIRNQFLDITDLVKESATDVSGLLDATQIASKGASETESRTIEDKMNQVQKDALNIDGKYYCIPHYEGSTAVSYDRDLFKEKKLFFKEGGGWTKQPEIEGTVGPNGIRGDYDDGLPSSYEEFLALCDHMVEVGVTPFTFPGGHLDYINHFTQSLFTAYLGANGSACWSFDSGDEKLEVITGWNNDGTPITEMVNITNENGYLTSQLAVRYWSQWLLSETVKNPDYYSDSAKTGSVSHVDDDRTYVNSKLDADLKPIAMKFDGSWWYNEAKDALLDSYKKYENSTDRDFAVMPMPWKITGTVTEGEGRKNALNDTTYAYAFLNANLVDQPVQLQVAKLFLKFCYTDKSLQEFTTTTGTFKALQYELTTSQLNSVDKYVQNLYNLRRVSDIVYPYSNSKIYIANQDGFAFYTWKNSMYNGNGEDNSYTIYKNGKKQISGTVWYTPKEIFEQAIISQSEWNSKFSQYFNK